jgi:hypothetical protein
MSSPKRQFFAFLLLFLVINLLQSTFTGLLEDESYYWVWSKNLAWGYFDHPPMVALFIWLGGLIFDGELGVRLISAFSFALTLWIMWKTIDSEGEERDVKLFFLLVVSLAMIQVYGFISTPDTPLMLFTALFFYAYKRFLEDDRIRNSLILGFSMAALLYSKYHGILIIGFVTLSNLKLFLNLRFWIAGIFGFALFIPHLLWQYENDFPSFVYHLKDRAYKPYEIGFTLNHLLNIIVVVGITFPIVYKAFWKKKASGMFEKSLKYTVFGFVLFFLLTSFRSQPQAQWLAAMLIPLGVFVYSYFMKNESARKWLYRLGLAQLGIVIVARTLLAVPSLSPVVLEPHWADSWIPEVREKTDGSPLVFVNSYQNASIYNFYTGIDTHSYGIPYGRKSQYSLLDTEAKLQGKSVFAVGKQLKDHTKLTHKMGRDLYGMPIDSFKSFQRIKTTVDLKALDMAPGDEIRVPFELINTYDRSLSFEKVHLIGMFQNRRKEVLVQFKLNLPDLKNLKPLETRRLEAVFTVPEPFEEEVVTFRIGVSFENLPAGLQGNKVLVNFALQPE